MIKIICYLTIILLTFCIDAMEDNNKQIFNPKETKFLEEAEGVEALEWAKERTSKTEKALQAMQEYKQIKKEIETIFYDQRKTPYGVIRKGYVYNFWMDDKNPQGLWRRTLVDNYSKDKPNWEVLIDFDKLSKKIGKKVAYRGVSNCFQNPNRYLISMSFGGKDEMFFREWDLEKKDFVKNGFEPITNSGKLLEGKFTYPTWINKDTIIFNLVLHKNEITSSLYPNSLYIWKRGESIEKAKKLFEVPKEYIYVSAGKLLSDTISSSLIFISANKDFYNYDNYILDTKYKNLKLQKINMPSDATLQGSFKEYVFWLLRSDWKFKSHNIKAGSLVALHFTDLLKTESDKTSLKILFTPTANEVFNFISTTKDRVFLATYDNVVAKVVTFTLENEQWTKPVVLKLPYQNAIFGMSSYEEEEEALITIENSIVPPTIYLWVKTHELKIIRKALYSFDSENYVLEQKEATSFDGVKIPYFLVYKKGIKFDGKNPTLLEAYGGFQVINAPYFSRIKNEVWVKNAGVSVLANIRGGGEFGPEWHKSAQGIKRQTAFNDFFAVSEELIKQNITSPEYLGIKGGSNGGLLVSVAMTQRPELFGAVACEVPILDMIRYKEFGAGHSWVTEYGDPEIPNDLLHIKKYAPLENLSLTQKYPTVLITDSVLDQRVHPWHGRIFEYVLAQNPNTKTYFLESKDSGHGSGSDLKESANYFINLYTFFANALKLKIN
ncbi:prolyl oligopeptidase family serine peptidase [Rickettsia typhi]|uniref:Post-proline cleaving enzyme n=2 Tax=Rickettsia typhi TaxID=785 RepID=Q68XJ3_RICTY|nr:prolyl oligopeptidase family protein [Rickettsia typhi]AAU03649.1 Post-proline cleaving enzyme [Rickettsia typhi str. Wilmington]AFE54027.1 post-proline cleaving enzyme [Rickettsia typhi str. TH1527]AFE54866.1 post-proline cleaving enzyme [Rickettsia typhi str. B9991CWPP]